MPPGVDLGLWTSPSTTPPPTVRRTRPIRAEYSATEMAVLVDVVVMAAFRRYADVAIAQEPTPHPAAKIAVQQRKSGAK
jgi:hypothetical protein